MSGSCSVKPEASAHELVPTLLEGIGLIRGCDCLFGAEVEVLVEADPESLEYQEIMFRLEANARQRCLEVAIEQGLVEHNCLSADVEGGLIELPGTCVAGCVYANPPPGGRCTGECTDSDDSQGESGDVDEGEAETETSGETETGADPPARALTRTEGAP